ncbi:uncharacterized protein LOC106053932 isoform X43 [Biomphalaria glabrata]|uniref:Uncharacterized protein LOC106053932 isoform X43 n=1 Tax=Biomphalaria glabrata TaxID=6526 RepID=A0A9W3BI33_BIOGL|nr:uncharacterized protein LOC106053932 isoform X43 [Biomphalaria glabrata]
MDFDSSSKFIASLAKFLQSLCNGYVDFDKGVEVIGHIYINVDSDTGKKVDYVLNEKVCKNDNSITFISNSFHAQPAEKPKPLPKKIPESEKQNEDTIVMEDSGPTVPNSTNVGTMGSFRNTPRGGTQDITFTPGSKRPRTPPLRRNLSSGKSGSPASKHMSPSTRYQDSGGPSTKISRSDIPPSPLINSGVGSEDYDNPNVFQSGGEEDDSQNYSSNFLEQNSSDLDQKPVIDPDISIVKEEYMSSQQNSCAYAGANQSSGSAPRGKHQQTAYPVMMHPNSSNYSGVTAAASHQSDSYSSASLEGAGDPSTLTRAQQEELEMYYRKGTDQHLTFLRNMREAHALYPFTGKRDKELFDKALAEVNSNHLAKVQGVSLVDNLFMQAKVIPIPREVTVVCQVMEWKEECLQLALKVTAFFRVGVMKVMITNIWLQMIAEILNKVLVNMVRYSLDSMVFLEMAVVSKKVI